MAKYWDHDLERVWTRSELKEQYEKQKRNGEIDHIEDLDDFIKHATIQYGGSLEKIAADHWIERLRRDVASDIACDEMPYNKCLDILQKRNIFGTWTLYEINNRPVDLNEISEMVAQELGVWGGD